MTWWMPWTISKTTYKKARDFMSLQDIPLKTEYRTLRDDIVNEFYVPLLKESISYNRAVGFFSSTILKMITLGLYQLFKNGGHVQLLASPKLSEDDIEVIQLGYENRTAIFKNALIRELRDYNDYKSRNRLNLLANLIAENKLDIKIVEPSSSNGLGMYHEKVGIIKDNVGNTIAFSGSMNETFNAIQQNYESFDVFCSWKDADCERVYRKEESFTTIWNDADPNVDVLEFPELNEYIINKYRLDGINKTVDNYIAENYETYTVDANKFGFSLPKDISLYDYQIEAINNWKDNHYRGIFDMATGTGKTLTGLGALAELSKVVNRLGVIIVCPYQHLVDQWVDDIRKFGVNPIIGHSDSIQRDYKKKFKDAVFNFELGISNFFCFICTNATFSLKDIGSELERLNDDIVLVVDEAHNFGAESLRKRLSKDYRYRLALSATLDRHNDPEGTESLYNFFGNKCIEYGLERAIKEKKLVPYNYFPVVIYLEDDELKKYHEISMKISHMIRENKNGKIVLTEQAKRLLIKRARIIAGARNKTGQLKELMMSHIKDHNILIYCGATNIINLDEIYNDELRQIDYISKMLNFELDMNTAQFTSREDTLERAIRIQNFEEGSVQALVAIKCLDEGVNIPSIDKAFILASTTNSKEYIQRRGRVLRRCPGKTHSDIYDFVTLPRSLELVQNTDGQNSAYELSLVKNEIARMVEFSSLAKNFYESDHLISDIKEAYNLYEDVDFAFDEWEEHHGRE